MYKHQCCCTEGYILQILFSSYSTLSFNQSLVVKIKKHFNQFTMSLPFHVIMCYQIFLPLHFPLRETIMESSPATNPVFSRVYREVNNKIQQLLNFLKQVKSQSGFVCEKPINKRMLICIACGNGSFEYRIELSKTRRQRLC